MVKPLKVGIIGANYTLNHHTPAWRLQPGVEVAAICTAHRETAEAAAAEFGIPKAYWNLADLVADPELDIIDVGTRPSLRYDMVVAALEHGKHVYNCIPFATSTAEADHLNRACPVEGADRRGRCAVAVDPRHPPHEGTDRGRRHRRLLHGHHPSPVAAV